ncbi:hypothetical protein [Lentzea sp. NBRC 102530]|uniref:hypothetical protein n=1 Tax=Lentzea sp. NBRC 102530 TaxID=3032201 RepID=UPI0025546C40|nr:hypothetical protein [Lentzea sp. NBRC 102530]
MLGIIGFTDLNPESMIFSKSSWNSATTGNGAAASGVGGAAGLERLRGGAGQVDIRALQGRGSGRCAAERSRAGIERRFSGESHVRIRQVWCERANVRLVTAFGSGAGAAEE